MPSTTIPKSVHSPPDTPGLIVIEMFLVAALSVCAHNSSVIGHLHVSGTLCLGTLHLRRLYWCFDEN